MTVDRTESVYAAAARLSEDIKEEKRAVTVMRGETQKGKVEAALYKRGALPVAQQIEQLLKDR